MIRMHTLGLSLNERAGKMTELYKFMTSAEYAHQFGELGQLADGLLELDVEDAKEHQRVWKKRGAALTRLKNVLRQIDVGVSAILEGAGESSPIPTGNGNLASAQARRSA